VGSNWVGFGGLDQVKTLLGVPEAFDVLAVVPFGYPQQATSGGKKNRKPLSEVVSYQHFGQPFPADA
jgi:nitroreductase